MSLINNMLKELEQSSYEFNLEAQEASNIIEENLLDTRHFLHVTDDAINEELARGIQDVYDAADDIDLPDDDAELD